ncbi:MAG: hypothetical protein JW944_00345 [Deltaproteobacteria bacterium]|nr:hypothetical protein [Deltaproteobacteria bacterium]
MVKSKYNLLLICENPEYSQSILDIYKGDNGTPVAFVTAETLSQGINRIRDGAIDAVFLSLSKPAMFEALASLRELEIRLPVIALIPVGEAGMGIRAIKEGAHNFLFENEIGISSLTRALRYAVESCNIAEELRLTRKKNGAHEKSAAEVERLKAVIENYRLAVHDLNQPLTALMGSIYLMGLEKDNREKISRHMERIEESGKRLSGIVKKIQALRLEKSNVYLGSASLLNPEKKSKSKVEIADDGFKNLNNLFRIVQARCNGSSV